MQTRIKHKTNAIIYTILFLLAFYSCSSNNITEEKNDSVINGQSMAERKRIAVIFNTSLTGENSGFIPESLQKYKFISVYGLAQQSPEKIPPVNKLEDGFMEKYVLPEISFRYATYPEDFIKEGITRIRDLTELINDKYLTDVILIDPPAKTDRYIAQIKDANPDINFYCLMPTEEILAMEAWCKNVLSFTVNTSIDPSADDETKPIDEENLVRGIRMLTEAAIINHMTNYAGLPADNPEEFSTDEIQNKKNPANSFLPVEVFTKLREKVPGTEHWEISRYTDPDTGLKSQNHFVIKPASVQTTARQD